MYEHLLVALDGSPAAERVLDHAEAIARAFSSTVTLIRATISAETLLAETAGAGQTAGDVGGLIDPTPIVDMDREDAEAYLEKIADRLRAHNLTVTTEHPQGPPADEIVERARATGANLIIMARHARGGLARTLFGSVADEVLRHASVPVMVIRVSESDDGTLKS